MSARPFMAPRDVSRRSCVDTAMALTLVALLGALVSGERWPAQLAVAVLVLGMIAPTAFRYPAVAWFGLAHVLGTISSKVLLLVLFVALVVPMGLARKLAGKDPLGLRTFRRGTGSLFTARNKRFSAEDLKNPY